jgi:ATP-dependent DNA helicase PIF1
MSKFPGEERLYRSFDTLEEEQFPAEFINTLTPSGFPPHELHLKVGAPIMLMRNFHPLEGHCNRTKYVIRRLHDRIIEAEIAGGNTLLIPRIKIKPSEQTFPFQMLRYAGNSFRCGPVLPSRPTRHKAKPCNV